MKRNPKDIAFVATQFLLFLLYLSLTPEIDIVLPLPIQYGGLALAAGGLLVAVKAIADLNRNLTAFPTPRKNAVLVRSGLYRYVRHPIYTGILIAALGYGLWSENMLRLILFGALAVLFYFKARYEERLLQERHPDYDEYRKGTGRFLPGI